MVKVVVCGMRRSPFARGGKGMLAATRLDSLSVDILHALLRDHPTLNKSHIDEFGLGQVLHADELLNMGSAQIAHLAGLPYEMAKFETNRQCGSSMEVVHRITQAMMLGLYDVGLAMGVERMGRHLTLQSAKSTRITRLNPELLSFKDPCQSSLSSLYEQQFKKSIPKEIYQSPPLCTMLQTAQNVADMYTLSREQLDDFVVTSHHKYGKALAAGIYDEEIVPLDVEMPVFDPEGKLDLTQHGDVKHFAIDEGYRSDVSLEKLISLNTVPGLQSYLKQPIVITAGNSCPTNDGVSAALLMTAHKAAELDIEPLAEIVGYAVVGVKPQVMGIGPVPAIRKALDRAGITIKDVDFIEFNEAFSAQVLATMSELDYPLDQVNIHGGSLAIGHPLGATGVRLVGTAARQIARSGSRYAIAAQCIGAGMGIATVLKSIR